MFLSNSSVGDHLPYKSQARLIALAGIFVGISRGQVWRD